MRNTPIGTLVIVTRSIKGYGSLRMGNILQKSYVDCVGIVVAETLWQGISLVMIDGFLVRLYSRDESRSHNIDYREISSAE